MLFVTIYLKTFFTHNISTVSEQLELEVQTYTHTTIANHILSKSLRGLSISMHLMLQVPESAQPHSVTSIEIHKAANIWHPHLRFLIQPVNRIGGRCCFPFTDAVPFLSGIQTLHLHLTMIGCSHSWFSLPAQRPAPGTVEPKVGFPTITMDPTHTQEKRL